nr:MAG TPA: N-6 DNA Methylase [Caudoviricetes sp.]
MDQEKSTPRDIMHYESDIWSIADLLLAASIKQSDFPTYMMPFFALVMLEGRMLNAIKEVIDEEGITPQDDPEDFKEAFLEKECGYNEYIVMKGKTLLSICRNDSTFDQDFSEYIKAFDDVLRKLLGINREKNEAKYLNMDGIVAELRSKKILMQVVSAWARIDLSCYDNSAITTLEEHIKRKWADISASTAGEQYTPDDIISLIAEIVAAKVSKPKNEYIHVYDPTCGGANLLFGVADRLNKQSGYNYIATYGSEYNDALYALAAIESRFRNNSQIRYGNTLTTVPFADKEFDVVVANPPYGTKWSGYEKEIKHDQKGQFPGGLPAVSDGQLLFMQHILWQLARTGIAVEVHNGSTLFTGDAGSGESNIRKYIFDHDWVEAIIQMPQQEFFNTGIYTYLWIMNKNKPQDRKDKVALIDASNGWAPLRKSKGNKRREMLPEHRQTIVDALMNFVDNDICKIYDREYFYYNKQSIMLYETDDNGTSVKQTICADGAAEIDAKSLVIDGKVFDKFKINAEEITALKNAWNSKKDFAVIDTDDNTYKVDAEVDSIIKTDADGNSENLGCGSFILKMGSISKKTGLATAKIKIESITYNDYEIFPHHFDEEANTTETAAFMDKYIYKPFEYGNNVVGVGINFNKEFYVPEKLEKVEDILSEIAEIDEQIKPISL